MTNALLFVNNFGYVLLGNIKSLSCETPSFLSILLGVLSVSLAFFLQSDHFRLYVLVLHCSPFVAVNRTWSILGHFPCESDSQ